MSKHNFRNFEVASLMCENLQKAAVFTSVKRRVWTVFSRSFPRTTELWTLERKSNVWTQFPQFRNCVFDVWKPSKSSCFQERKRRGGPNRSSFFHVHFLQLNWRSTIDEATIDDQRLMQQRLTEQRFTIREDDSCQRSTIDHLWFTIRDWCSIHDSWFTNRDQQPLCGSSDHNHK